LQPRLPFCNAPGRMLPRPLTVPALFAAAALALGCHKPPKPPPPPPAPTVEPEAPKPPPKCEKLDEKCEAKPDTRARVAHTPLFVTPVAGWTYAQQDDATIALASETGPSMAFGGWDEDKDAKKDAAAREAAFGDLLKALKVDPGKPPKKVPWKSPTAPKSTGELKLDLWEIPGWSRNGKKGELVVVAGSSGDGKGALAVSFAPEDDKTADDAITKSFESIGKSK
jgi:hypothetical protein